MDDQRSHRKGPTTLASIPVSPAQRLGRDVSPELEAALLACLEKSRAKRPQTARDLANLLDRAPTAARWSLDDAEAWWGRQERTIASEAAAAAATTAISAMPRQPRGLLSDGHSQDRPALDATAGLEQTMLPGERQPQRE